MRRRWVVTYQAASGTRLVDLFWTARCADKTANRMSGEAEAWRPSLVILRRLKATQ